MICWYCNQVFWSDRGELKCKADGKTIPGNIYYSRRPCNCPLDKEPDKKARRIDITRKHPDEDLRK